MIKVTFKAILVNFLIIFSFILIIEIFFGYWFDTDNLGPFMREHRMKNQRIEYTLNGVKEVYFYRRNYYGFRGKDMEPSEIKAIIMGGSNIEQRYEPERNTITGFLNSNIKRDNINFTIVNAGIEAQSTRGMILSFKNWLFKLKDFSPEIIIFYVGITDNRISEDDSFNKEISEGNILNKSKIEQIKDNIKSRSIVLDSIRIFKFKFLPKKGFVKYDGNQDLSIRENFNYKNYDDAKKIFDLTNLKITYNSKIKNYLLRIDKLQELSKKLNSEAIFVTNVSANGYSKVGFTLNSVLMEHCYKKKYTCFDVARNLKADVAYWKDGVHTTRVGSKAIADLIYFDLKKMLVNR